MTDDVSFRYFLDENGLQNCFMLKASFDELLALKKNAHETYDANTPLGRCVADHIILIHATSIPNRAITMNFIKKLINTEIEKYIRAKSLSMEELLPKIHGKKFVLITPDTHDNLDV